MRDLSHSKIQTRNTFFTSFRINIGLLAFLMLLSLVYVFSLNSISTANFQIKKLSNQLSVLEEDHKNLELQNSTLQSVTSIQAQTSHLNFVPATGIKYLRDEAVALR